MTTPAALTGLLNPEAQNLSNEAFDLFHSIAKRHPVRFEGALRAFRQRVGFDTPIAGRWFDACTMILADARKAN